MEKHLEARRSEIIEGLIKAYWMELETVMNFIANATNLVGVKAEPIKQSLAADATEEVTHAQMLARRIHILGGFVPGSGEFSAAQVASQPPEDSTDAVSVIRGVIEAENAVISQYLEVIALCDGVDPVTEDLCVTLLADEEEHRRVFQGYLTEYEKV